MLSKLRTEPLVVLAVLQAVVVAVLYQVQLPSAWHNGLVVAAIALSAITGRTMVSPTAKDTDPKPPTLPTMMLGALWSFVLAALLATACTAAAERIEVKVGEALCAAGTAILLPASPELAPLCITAGEWVAAELALNATASAPAPMPATGVIPHPADDLHRQITAARADGGA